MPYMNYTPGAAGGSAMTVGPGAGGPGGGVPGGGDDAFMEMLAMARADKRRKEREQMELARRELGMQEGRDLQARLGESERRQFAGQELRGRERGEAQRLVLAGQEMRSRAGLEEEQRKEMAAQREAMGGFVPTSIITGGPGIVPGRVQDPTKGTVRQQQIYGRQGSSFAAPGSAGLGPSGARIMPTADEQQEMRLARIAAMGGGGGGGGGVSQEEASAQTRAATARRMKRYGYGG